MTSSKLCKYYLDSKCMLEGGYCDLNCNRPSGHEDSEFYDGIDTLNQWGNEIDLGALNSIPILPKLERMN
jgi:hypothetical protein